MKKSFIVLSAILVLVAGVVGWWVLSGNDRSSSPQESVYDRVMRNKTIRCSYIVYEPYITKDMRTGKLGGMTYDYVNSVAERLGLKVDWAGEVNIDQVPTNLDADRFDVFCVPCTGDKYWEKVVEFPGYLGALAYYVYIPQKSSITEEQLQTAKFAIVDSYALSDVTRIKFPNAKYLSLPQTVSMAEMYDQLRYGKVDALVNENISAISYMKNNSGVIRRFSDKPLILWQMFLITKYGDKKMSDFVDKEFDSNRPDNLALMKELRKKYGVPAESLLLGDQCKKSVRTEKGWRICEE